MTIIPTGWVLVPAEPTKEMLVVIHLGSHDGFDDEDHADTYRDMIAAAPKHESREDAPEFRAFRAAVAAQSDEGT